MGETGTNNLEELFSVMWVNSTVKLPIGATSVGGSPAEAGGGLGSPWGQGHLQQKFWEVLLGMHEPSQSRPSAPPP